MSDGESDSSSDYFLTSFRGRKTACVSQAVFLDSFRLRPVHCPCRQLADDDGAGKAEPFMVEVWTNETDGTRYAVADKCLVAAYDSYARAAQHTDPRTSDFVLTELAGTTTIGFSDNYVHITGYSQLLALPALCEDTRVALWEQMTDVPSERYDAF
jgi:hypothetical protein